MRRVFSSPVTALLTGACLRLLFVLKFPAGSGDTVVYQQLAANWLKLGKYAMEIGGQPASVDLRMPGYPAFLAIVYALTGRTGESARLFVMLAQLLVDLAACLVIAALAALLVRLCIENSKPKRVFIAALWLAALCPFTVNYVAVPLTETWAVFLTAIAMSLMVLVATRASGAKLPFSGWMGASGKDYWKLAALAGFAVGLGTLFRPETPLLLVTSCAVLGYWQLRRGEWKKWVLTCALMGAACGVALAPWVIRNALTLHEFQPLAPRNTILPGEVDPQGFMAWEHTWLYRVRDCYLVPWKLDDDSINLEDIPAAAFDTPDEKARVAMVLERYNDELSWTSEEDAAFAQLARERTARHPARTYLWIPLRRMVRIWFTPRIELLPVAGNVFPLAYLHEDDPVDQRTTIVLFFLNIVYVGLALWGASKLWQFRAARPALLVMALYLVVRTAFLTTLETPEPRYVLVCFPALMACAAQLAWRRPSQLGATPKL